MDLTLDQFQKYTGLTLDAIRFEALLLHASSVISRSFFEELYPYALSLMIAHLNTLLTRPYESGRDITEISVGDMSVKFSDQTTGELMSSRWGDCYSPLLPPRPNIAQLLDKGSTNEIRWSNQSYQKISVL